MSALEGSAMVTFLSGLFDKLSGKLDTIKIRYSSTDFFKSVSIQVSYNSRIRDVFYPSLKFKTGEKTPVRLQSLQIIFDDVPSDDFRPRVSIEVNGGILHETKYEDEDNPYLNADINLNFGTGKTIYPNDDIKIFLWSDGDDIGDKKATVSYTLGEYC